MSFLQASHDQLESGAPPPPPPPTSSLSSTHNTTAALTDPLAPLTAWNDAAAHRIDAVLGTRVTAAARHTPIIHHPLSFYHHTDDNIKLITELRGYLAAGTLAQHVDKMQLFAERVCHMFVCVRACVCIYVRVRCCLFLFKKGSNFCCFLIIEKLLTDALGIEWESFSTGY